MCDDDKSTYQRSNVSGNPDAKVCKMSDIISDMHDNWQRLQDTYNVLQNDLDQTKEHHEYLEKMHKDLKDFVTKDCDRRNTTTRNPEAKDDNNYDIVTDISWYYQQLQHELEKYKQEAKQWKSKEDNYIHLLKEKDTELDFLKRKTELLDKTLQHETEKYEQIFRKLNEKETVNVVLAEKQIGLQGENKRHERDIEYFKRALDEAQKRNYNYSAVQEQYTSMTNQLNGRIQEQSNQIYQQTLLIRKKDRFSDQLQKNMATLEEKCNTLTLRLSKLGEAHLTRINPNITDLFDTNRPTKLAEKYSELYDNEWTDAYEEFAVDRNMDEETCVKTMLDLLKTANDECLKLLQPHRDVLKTLTMVTVKLDITAVKQDTYVQTEEWDRTDEFLRANTNTMLTGEDQSTVNITEVSGRRQHQQCQQSHSACPTETTVEQLIQTRKVAELPFELNEDTGEVTAEIIVTDDFTEEQKKAVLDMRKLCGTKLEREGSISKLIAMKVAKERGINIKSSVMTYITKCAQLCWYMAIQHPPVVIGFQETAADGHFNTDVYKAYTWLGKKLDFVVWPPVYLYKDGPMLCKGTAQGKN